MGLRFATYWSYQWTQASDLFEGVMVERWRSSGLSVDAFAGLKG